MRVPSPKSHIYDSALTEVDGSNEIVLGNEHNAFGEYVKFAVGGLTVMDVVQIDVDGQAY